MKIGDQTPVVCSDMLCLKQTVVFKSGDQHYMNMAQMWILYNNLGVSFLLRTEAVPIWGPLV